MIILTIRTDKPEAELGVFDNEKQLEYFTWQAHRELGTTINLKVEQVLNKSGKSLEDLGGIVCFAGPGSFTGLRIGLSVANALAYAQNIPVVARDQNDWLVQGIKDLLAGKNDKIAKPKYGQPAFVTLPKK